MSRNPLKDEKPKTAAVLEDAPLELRRLEEVLRQAGFGRVLAAADARELLMLMAAELVQLVLVPWGTPDFTGPELLRAVRERGQNRNVPVIILDDGLAGETIVRAVKAGVAGRLQKPARAEQLLEILARFGS